MISGQKKGWIPNGIGNFNLIYKAPQINIDNRFFGDLTAFAPGLHTTMADIYATVEAEATAEKQPLIGVVPEAARRLIDKARSAGWQTLTIPGYARVPGFNVVFNGAGQFTYERVLDSGLHEQVIGDGASLLSLYPEIGLGGRRPFSRFHQGELAEMVPWYLPKAEYLAHGADLKMVDDSTVAIVPRLVAEKEKDGKELPTLVLHLVFAKDGRLAERRIVEMPSLKILVRQTYGADGTVKIINPKDDKVLVETKLTIAKGEAPNLKADTKEFLMMEFPVRTSEFWTKQEPYRNNFFANVNAKLMEQLFVSYAVSGNLAKSGETFGRRFHAEGDHRIGFYTLLSLNVFEKGSKQFSWIPNNPLPNNEEILFDDPTFIIQLVDPTVNSQPSFNLGKEHPTNPLAFYLAHLQTSVDQKSIPLLENLPESKNTFIRQLTQLHNVWSVWMSLTIPRGMVTDKMQEGRAQALKFIEETKSPLFCLGHPRIGHALRRAA